MKKTIDGYTITSNCKKQPILGWYDLTDKESETYIRDYDLMQLEEDNFIRVNNEIYSFTELNNGYDWEHITHYLLRNAGNNLERVIVYIYNGYFLTKAILIDYDYYVIYNVR